MLRLFFILCLFTVTPGFSQTVCNWVNDQYDAGDWGEYGNLFYWNSVNGKVKSREVYEFDVELNQQVLISTTLYDTLGRIIAMVRCDSGGEVDKLVGAKYSFAYNAIGDSVLVRSETPLNDTVFYEENYGLVSVSILAPPVPDSSHRDSNGNVTAFWHNKDVTYSFYDEFGRKTYDSIPDGMSWAHNYQYQYLGNKVIQTYWDEHERISSIYELDVYGNWIKSYSANESEHWEMSQKFTYYPE